MVTIQVKNIEGKTTLPIAGSELAAGYDIIAIDDPIIVGQTVTKEGEFFPFYKNIDYIEYHTALYISPQKGESYAYTNKENYHTLLHPRSSIRKMNLVLANSIGLIDNDYRGEIILCFKYIWQPEDYVMEYNPADEIGPATPTGDLLGKLNREKIYKKGDKIGQLVAELTNPIEFQLVTELDSTNRGEGGFGSTDKPKINISETTSDIPKIPGKFIKIEKNVLVGRMYPQEVMDKELGKLETSTEEKGGTYGTIVDQYNKVGGVPIKKKYSEEIKERNSQ